MLFTFLVTQHVLAYVIHFLEYFCKSTPFRKLMSFKCKHACRPIAVKPHTYYRDRRANSDSDRMLITVAHWNRFAVIAQYN